MGTSHDDVQIADDVERKYLFGLPVDLLNEYDEKVNVMESKLEELGYMLIFRYDNDYKESMDFKKILTKNPSPNDNGEWIVISVDDYEKFTNKQSKLM